MTDPHRAWYDKKWPIVTGCTPVSRGCDNCCAEHLASLGNRPRDFSVVRTHGDRLEYPLTFRGQRIFVAPTGDLFHPDISDGALQIIFDLMRFAKGNRFYVLTKRIERAARWCMGYGVPPNVWFGVSVEDQASANVRVPWLLRIPAAMLFINVEPMLEAIDFEYPKELYPNGRVLLLRPRVRLHGLPIDPPLIYGHGHRVRWITCGAEYGKSPRPFDIEWARALAEQASRLSIPFYFKGAGNGVPAPMDMQIYEYPALVKSALDCS